MKIKTTLMVSLFCGAALWLGGCEKSPTPPPTPPQPASPSATDASKAQADAQKAAQDAAKAAADAASKAVQDAAAKASQEAAAAKAAQEAAAKQAAADAAAKAQAASQEVQGKIDQAKKLIADKKYPDALALLQQLLNTALSGDQKTETDALITQTKKAMAGEALKSGGGFLK